MLKKSVVTCLCFMFFVLSLSQQGNCAEQNHILFCRTFNDKWEPIDPSETFETNVVSWIAQGEKSFETPRIIVSLYKKIGRTTFQKQKSGSSQNDSRVYLFLSEKSDPSRRYQ